MCQFCPVRNIRPEPGKPWAPMTGLSLQWDVCCWLYPRLYWRLLISPYLCCLQHLGRFSEYWRFCPWDWPSTRYSSHCRLRRLTSKKTSQTGCTTGAYTRSQASGSPFLHIFLLFSLALYRQKAHVHGICRIRPFELVLRVAAGPFLLREAVLQLRYISEDNPIFDTYPGKREEEPERLNALKGNCDYVRGEA